jgi:hypothetical protein
MFELVDNHIRACWELKKRGYKIILLEGKFMVADSEDTESIYLMTKENLIDYCNIVLAAEGVK